MTSQLYSWTKKLSLIHISWDYLKNNRKECEVDPVKKYGEQKINVPIGFPDHAMLLAEIELDD